MDDCAERKEATRKIIPPVNQENLIRSSSKIVKVRNDDKSIQKPRQGSRFESLFN